MFSPKQWIVCGLILLGATACRTTLKPALSQLPEATPPPQPEPVRPVLTIPVTPPPPPTPPPVKPTLPPATWIAWEDECQDRGWSYSQSIDNAADTVYSANTVDGVFSIRVGSRVALWNGTVFWLGYAPKLISGQPHIHSLDLRKSFLPLSQPAAAPVGTRRVVVVDPGHGGFNAGTRSVADRRWEKEFTLDWALRLKPLLEAKGWTVFLTRTNDTELQLVERVAFTENHRADLFLSLHFNSAAPNQDATGIETYCLTPTGMPSQLIREETEDAAEIHPNNGFDDENLRLAMRIHRALLEATGGTDRGVRRARFMGVLKGQSRPAVLIEGGFLSNPKEAGLIGTGEYRDRLAAGIARALEAPTSGKDGGLK